MSSTNYSEQEAYLASRDSTLARLIDEYGPCPLTREDGDPIHTLFTAIIAQQISAKAARGIKGRFIDLLGEDSGSWVSQLLETTEEQLRRLGLSRNKASSISGLARSFSDGDLDISRISSLTDEQAMSELTRFKGIGPWTAEMFLLFGLRRLDTFTLRDAGLRRGIQHAYEYQAPPTDEDLKRLSDSWSPYRGVASWYMWRVVD